MTISIAQIEDLDQILTIIELCIRHMDEKGIQQWPNWYPNKSVLEEDITKKQLFVAKEEEQVLGFVTLSPEMPNEYSSLEWKENTPANSIHRLATNPNKRRKGIAKLLMKYCEGLAIEKAFRSIRLDTYSLNTDANAFYKGLGYQWVGDIHLEFMPELYHCYEKALKK